MSLTINRYSERWSPGEKENQRQSLTFEDEEGESGEEWVADEVAKGKTWFLSIMNLIYYYYHYALKQ